MAYTRKNFLLRVKEVNEIYLEQSHRGLRNEYIYAHFIRNRFHISRTTFYQYLTIPYNAELKWIERCEAERKRIELSLF